MRICITKGGMCAIFWSVPETENTAALRDLPTRGGAVYGSWIEAQPYLDCDEQVEFTGREELVEFLRRREEMLNHSPRTCPTDWLNPGLHLLPYQQEAVAALLVRRRLLLADEFGLSTIPVAIGATCLLREAKKDARAAIVVPPGRLSDWAAEFRRLVREEVLSPGEVVIVDGDAKRRSRALGLRRPVTILSYSSLTHDIHVDHSRQLHGPGLDAFGDTTLVVFDDVGRLAEVNSETTMTARAVVRSIPFRLGLSAVPIERDVEGLFSILTVLDPDVPGDRRAFLERYLHRILDEIGGREFYTTVGSRNLDHLRERIRHIHLRRTTEEVADQLPPHVSVPVRIELASNARRAYREIRTRAGKARCRDEITEAVTAARRFCCDPRLAGLSGGPHKVRAIISLINKELSNASIIVFSEVPEFTRQLQETIGDVWSQIKVHRSPRDRREAEKLFGEGELRVLVDDAAIAQGDPLPADVVINADIPWRPTNFGRRVARARAPGPRTRPLRVITLITRGTIEERMFDRLVREKELDSVFASGEGLEDTFEGLTDWQLKALA